MQWENVGMAGKKEDKSATAKALNKSFAFVCISQLCVWFFNVPGDMSSLFFLFLRFAVNRGRKHSFIHSYIHLVVCLIVCLVECVFGDCFLFFCVLLSIRIWLSTQHIFSFYIEFVCNLFSWKFSVFEWPLLLLLLQAVILKKIFNRRSHSKRNHNAKPNGHMYLYTHI